MRKKDTSDVVASAVAVIMDGLAVFGGLMLATWIRFEHELVPLKHGRPDQLYQLYSLGAAFATLVFLLVFRSQRLFVRPQTGSFLTKIPRILKGVGVGTVLTVVLAFAVRNEVAEFSGATIFIGMFTTGFAVLFERYIMFRIEWNLARHSNARNNVLILGTDSVAAHVRKTIKREPMLRSKVIGFMRLEAGVRDESIREDEVKGGLDDIPAFLEKNDIGQVILVGAGLKHDSIMEIVMLSERHLITFNMVPDLFRIMTTSMDFQSLDDIPLLGIGRWPLDFFWNRTLKRLEDIAGSLVGLIVASPVIAVAGCVVKATSPGPMFYRQERCGEEGRAFSIYKLRTMRADAEAQTGPVFASEDDPRTTPFGGLLRKHNIDELPQLWNVLMGEMSLVGPRPERPHFVEQFKDDIARYMWRHVSKPGMTGWAQVNGLRGNTSIEERVKYDLYYLENWSLAFDFKILVRTVFASENAY